MKVTKNKTFDKNLVKIYKCFNSFDRQRLLLKFYLVIILSS